MTDDNNNNQRHHKENNDNKHEPRPRPNAKDKGYDEHGNPMFIIILFSFCQ